LTIDPEEEVVKPDLLGRVDDPQIRAELENFKPPSPHRRKTERHITETCHWVLSEAERRKEHIERKEVVDHIILRYNLSTEQASKMFAEVVSRFKRRGFPVVDWKGQPV